MFWPTTQPKSKLERLAENSPLIQSISSSANQAKNAVNDHLQGYESWQILLLGVVVALVLSKLLSILSRAQRTWVDKGWKQLAAGFILDLPGVRGFVARQQAATTAKLRESLQKGKDVTDAILILPKEGISAAQIKSRLARKAHDDLKFVEGESKVSGAVYLSGTSHQLLLNEVYKQFSITNPMHADVFPSVRKMEGEVVAMTAALLGGGPAGDPGVCGAMTSGGTESILTAVKASRDYMAATRGIEHPEMVVADSAHAAFIKAAEYFKIRLIKVPVGKDYRLSAKAVSKAISRNTILVVASSPGFPHGVMDHIEDISVVTQRRGVLFHVDCCLGGFVLPFARDLGYSIPPFDFSIPGVTSISVDTHKFGQAHKGTSVVLYRNAALRRYQYTSITDWSGGLYISPGFAGSRSGALISTAWAAMVHMGRDGYVAATKIMMDAALQFSLGVSKIDCLEVIGRPEMSVVAFKSIQPDVLNIYKVNDLLSARGWHLNALQRPAALHICFTAAHSAATVAELLRDLEECVAGVLAHPESGGDGMAPLYGMAATVPDRRIVGNFLIAYQDILLEPL
jgi:sphinganine-1-phosphate aldolase